MTRTIISTDKAPAPVGPYSQAVKAGGFLYVSGQIAICPESGELKIGDIQEETKLVLQNMKAVVEAGGCTMDDVVKVNIFLADMGDFAKMNEIYGTFFTENPPARACIQAACLPKNVNVEIECIAYDGS